VYFMAGKKYVKPKWLEEWRRRTKIISIIERAFELGCDCEVCQMLRELGIEMEDMMQLQPPSPPLNLGGEVKRQRKKKRK